MPDPTPVVIATTGGTIGSRRDVRGSIVVANGPRLVDGLGPGISHLELANQPSTATTPQQVLDWHARLCAAVPAGGAAVLTVGTNTMEEVSFLLHVIHGLDWPIVVTGAMRPADHPAADGPGNVTDAVAVARSARARMAGVTIVMNEEILSAPGARKVAGQGLAAFAHPQGRLGHVDTVAPGAREVRWHRDPFPPPNALLPLLEERVSLVASGMGVDGEVVRRAASQGARGIVVEGFAGGDVTPDLGEAMVSALAQGVAVVLADSGAQRPGAPTYDGVGEGVWLAEHGVVRADGLSARQARLLLMLALAQPNVPWTDSMLTQLL